MDSEDRRRDDTQSGDRKRRELEDERRRELEDSSRTDPEDMSAEDYFKSETFKRKAAEISEQHPVFITGEAARRLVNGPEKKADKDAKKK